MEEITEKKQNQLTEKNTLAQNISFFRKKLGISQTELAKKLQYSNKNISKWELGETTPDIFTIKKLAKIFGVSIDTLVNPITDENKKAIKTQTVVPTKFKIYMLLLINSIFLLLACIAFVLLKSFNVQSFPIWSVFAYMLIGMDICVFIFSCNILKKTEVISLSLLGWIIAICCHITFANYKHIGYIYIIAIGYQILAILLAKLINSGKIIKFNKILIGKKTRQN